MAPATPVCVGARMRNTKSPRFPDWALRKDVSAKKHYQNYFSEVPLTPQNKTTCSSPRSELRYRAWVWTMTLLLHFLFFQSLWFTSVILISSPSKYVGEFDCAAWFTSFSAGKLKLAFMKGTQARRCGFVASPNFLSGKWFWFQGYSLRQLCAMHKY